MVQRTYLDGCAVPSVNLLDLSTGEESLVSNGVPPLVLPLVDQALVS